MEEKLCHFVEKNRSITLGDILLGFFDVMMCEKMVQQIHCWQWRECDDHGLEELLGNGMQKRVGKCGGEFCRQKLRRGKY